MLDKMKIPYQPERVSHPGETVADLLEEQNMTQTELAQRMGRPFKTINEIINAKAAITPETALQLEKVLGAPARYWLNHEANYRAWLARQKEEEVLEKWHDWLDKMPVQALKAEKILPALHNRGKNRNTLLRELLHFFGVASPIEWDEIYGQLHIAYRRSQPELSDPNSIATWLRLGELQAAKCQSTPFQREQFLNALKKIRSLTVEPPEIFEPNMKKLCAAAGVTLILTPAIPRSRVSGAARWLNNRPLIQLSLYGKKNDRFWFTFFHEAAHILFHDHKLVFLDDSDDGDWSQEEKEANNFAQESLIPSKYTNILPTLNSKESVRHYAQQIGIHPGIVVGRLHHEQLIDPSWMNELRDTFAWKEAGDE